MLRDHLLATLLLIACATTGVQAAQSGGAAPAPLPAPAPPAPAAGGSPAPAAPPVLPPAAAGPTTAASSLPAAPAPAAPGGEAAIDPASVRVRAHAIAWDHLITFDEAGVASEDSYFDLELSLKTPEAVMLSATCASVSAATTDAGEALAQVAPAFDWSQGIDQPSDELSCHIGFKLPTKPAKELTVTGTLRVAPAAALRYLDLSPLGTYAGQWVGVQGMADGAVHPYRLGDQLWFQFSPAFANVFHCIEYADPAGEAQEISDWNASEGPPAAYSNNLIVGDLGRVSLGYIDLAKAVLVPFTLKALPLDGRAVERSAPPARLPIVAPTRPASQALPSSSRLGIDKF
jgi:hypothetical protein